MARSTRRGGRQSATRTGSGNPPPAGTPRGGAGASRGGGRRRGGRAAGGEFTAPVSQTPPLPAVDDFAALGLPAHLLRVLGEQGVSAPFPIQAATLPNSLAGRDVLGRGRTGSGKTLAFGLAVLARLDGVRAEPRRPAAMVLVPTRELAQQVTEALAPYAKSLGLRLATVVGGVSVGRQAAALRDGTEVVVATPGRLKDLIERGDCRLDDVDITVLDEADQMTDLGFLPQITRLLEQTRPDGQRLLFSATLDRNVDSLVRRYLRDPVVHSVDPSAGAVTTMEHHVLYVQDTDKRATATEIAARDGRVIMFLDTKHAVDRFTRHLLKSGVRASALHGGKSQPQRNRTLSRFKEGDVTVLVATNVAARGIHVDDLDLVVNVDPPGDHKDYLHRGGRTARAGESGSVVTLVLPHQRRDVDGLFADAGVTPRATAVRSGEAELNRITGARAPSGTPVVLAPPAASRPSGGGARGGTGTNGTGGTDGTGRSARSRGGAGRRRRPRRGTGGGAADGGERRPGPRRRSTGG
ncbi:DEAD/DEAH box helicase [Streptomyces durbertensis]|uniref:DEAD/DEAH box helicase n=1 Tax=Streptomyces durbertensis TaxID=2448886 RepID=A0ABR6EFP1_9ACTN|nr:DEAD/DEAH box helicase [Streptomyces durbertensis]MBB1244144.1 DEAD/DEAH box helicase [Streptomyces durbertensis]